MTGGRRVSTGSLRLTLFLATLTLAALVLASIGAGREAWERGEFYLFTSRFFTDIPARLMGPGRFRFLMQPIMAVLLGLRQGRADRPASGRAAGGVRAVANLVMIAILLDLIFQWIILGAAYPGAALVVGPVLISGPYAVARGVARRSIRKG